jgi:hypothetical protein
MKQVFLPIKNAEGNVIDNDLDCEAIGGELHARQARIDPS